MLLSRLLVAFVSRISLLNKVMESIFLELSKNRRH